MTTAEEAREAGCRPASPRADCTLAIVFLDAPITLAEAEEFANRRNAYLNVLYRTDAVCVAKDFPFSPGVDLGETASRRAYWEAEDRMKRIARARSDGFVPPVTMGGFNLVVDARMSEEWKLAQEPGVLFDNLGLWIDSAGAAELAGDYTVDFPEFGRYEHSEGRGEVAIDRHYDPPSLLPVADPGCVAADF